MNVGRDIQEFLNSLFADLRDKHLLPVVGVLAIAAVAIPIYVSKHSKPASPPPPVPVAANGATPAVVRPSKPVSHAPATLGAPRDPFPHVSHGGPGKNPNNGKAIRVIPTGGTTGPTGPSGTATPPFGTTGPSGASGPSQAPKPSPGTSLKVYSASLHFGQGTSLQGYSDFMRLDALPSVAAPVAQYLGIEQNGKTAVFLLWSIRNASGDGVCVGGVTPCDLLKLHAGQTEFIDAPSPNAGTIQYELVLDSIKVKKASSSSVALALHGQQSVDGAKLVLKSTSPALGQLKYSTKAGVLVPRSTGTPREQLSLFSLISQYGRSRAARAHQQ